MGPQQLSTFLFTNACGTPTAGTEEKLHMISEMFANIVDEILKSFLSNGTLRLIRLKG